MGNLPHVYGGPTMVVLLVTKAGVTCEWLDDEGNVRIVTYNPATLTK